MSNAMILRPQTFDQLMMFSDMAARSTMVPKDYVNKPDNIMVAVQMGSEIGLAPMQALQNIAVINGRPAVWGDAMLGLCKSHPAWGGISERIEGEGDAMRAICEIARKGDNPVTATFSVDDAKKATLWGKGGPWQQYPKRMLQMRARGFALRDAFPDALKGLISAEEAQDIPRDTFTGTTINAEPEPEPEPVRTADTVNTAPAPAKRQTWAELVAEIGSAVGMLSTEAEVTDFANDARVKKVMDMAGQGVKDEVSKILGDAYNRVVEANMQRADEPMEDDGVHA